MEINKSGCKICNNKTIPWCEASVMAKYKASYVKCGRCDFIYVEDPYWLSDSYSNAITKTDIGLVQRNIHYAPIIVALTHALIKEGRRLTCLDYGAGYGLLVRMLRDIGVDCQGYDRYCEPIFSRQFSRKILPEARYDFITAIEVMEHLEDPHEVFRLLDTHTDSLLFTTELQPSDNAKPENWWYYCLEHGQHISLYSLESLKTIARQYKATLLTNGHGFHILTKRKTSKWLRVLFRHKLALIYNSLIVGGRGGLAQHDYNLIRDALMSGESSGGGDAS